MQIGIAGTGKMGTAIAQRLLEVGHEVTAWALTTERMYVLQSIMTAVPLMELFETRGH